MNNMSLSEALTEGLLVTGVGLIIVFSVLIILMIVMMAMKKIFYKEPNSKSENKISVGSGITIKSKSDKDLSKDPNLPVVIAAAVAASEDTSIVAVLAAAVAAYTDVSPNNLRIKSYRKINDDMPAWKRAGLRETISSKR